MAPTPFSGALTSKRKPDLLEIARALKLNESGTRDELAARINIYLLEHHDRLVDDPMFHGLIARRRRTIAPAFAPQQRLPNVVTSRDLELEKQDESSYVMNTRSGRRITLDSSTSSDKSLQQTNTSPSRQAYLSSTAHVEDGETDSAVDSHAISPATRIVNALQPFSPSRLMNRISRPDLDIRSRIGGVMDAVRIYERDLGRKSGYTLASVSLYLSNSANIWLLIAILELAYILYVIVPWQYVEVPIHSIYSVGARSESSSSSSHPPYPLFPFLHTFAIAYPPLVTFRTPSFWLVLLHWFLPTVLIPSVAGWLLNFKPHVTDAKAMMMKGGEREATTGTGVREAFAFHPLSSSIVRVAAQYAYPYSYRGARFSGSETLSSMWAVEGLDVLGREWRIFDAVLGATLALAEAVDSAGQMSETGKAVMEKPRELGYERQDIAHEDPASRKGTQRLIETEDVNGIFE